MNFIEINEKFRFENLKLPDLDILRQDAQLYTTLLFQPSDPIIYTNEYIRFADVDLARKKFISFFDLGLEKNVELAITPEYSCPWEVISHLIVENKLPHENKLWIIGCESITPKKLTEFISKYPAIKWVYEEDMLKEPQNGFKFLDPVCYIFKTSLANSADICDVIIVQFKTHEMGGNPWERDNLIKGEDIYVLKNNNNSTRLITLICADALVVEPNNLYDGFLNAPHYIVHIQFNQKPNHPDFSKYRNDIFRMGWSNKEVICLNWAKGVKNNGTLFTEVSGSALYIHTGPINEIDMTDTRINNNHKLGIYYNLWKQKHTNVYFFNYDEFVFAYRNTKPSQAAVPVPNRKRTGPEMINTRIWDSQKYQWIECDKVDDGFAELCQSIDPDILKSICDPHNNSVDAERLVGISTGIATEEKWYHVPKNEFFSMDDDEIPQRTTFAQNPCPKTQSKRRKRLHSFARLINIVKNDNNIPDIISNLQNNCSVKYRPAGYEEEFNFNIFPENDNGAPAVGVYLGGVDYIMAKMLLDKMNSLFPNNQNGNRIVIWYEDTQGNIQAVHKGTRATITGNVEKSPNAITLGKR